MYQEICTLYPPLLLKQPGNCTLVYLYYISSSDLERTVIKITHNTCYNIKYKIKGIHISTEDAYKLTEQRSELFRIHSKYQMLNTLVLFFVSSEYFSTATRLNYH